MRVLSKESQYKDSSDIIEIITQLFYIRHPSTEKSVRNNMRNNRNFLRLFRALNDVVDYNEIYLYDRRSRDMAISYNKLWKLLVDRKMSKADLRKAVSIAPNTMTRLNRDEQVSLTVLNKICSVLDVNIGDIMEFLPDNESDYQE